MAKKKSDSEKLVYVSVMRDIKKDEEHYYGLINWRAGYSNKKTNFYIHEMTLAECKKWAAAYDYIMFEGSGAYRG